VDGWVDSGLAAILDFDKIAQNLHSGRFFIHREVGSIRNSYKKLWLEISGNQLFQ